MAQGYSMIPTSNKKEIVSLNEVDDEVLKNLNREEKIERVSTDTGLATEMDNLMSTESGRGIVNSASEQGQGFPLTTIDYFNRAKKEGDTNYSNTLDPVPVTGASKGGSSFRETFFNAPKLPGKELFSATSDLPEILYTTIEDSGETIPNALAFSKTVKRRDTEGRKDQGVYTFDIGLGQNQDVDLYSGVVRINLPVNKEDLPSYQQGIGADIYLGGQNVPTQPMYIKFTDRSYKEIKANVTSLMTRWNFRNSQDLPNPDFQSSAEVPLEFSNYGLNIRAKKTAINNVTGYNENVENILFKKTTGQTVGPVYDLGKLAAIDGLPLLAEGAYRAGTTVASAFNIIDETDWGVDKATGKKSEIYQRNLDYSAAKRAQLSAAIPSSGDILTTWLVENELDDITDGGALWTAQSISNMLENRNASMMQRFFVDYAAGLSFVSVLDNVVLKAFGKGPNAAKQFVRALNGDIISPKSMKATGVWETGFDFWKKEQIKKSNVQLKQEWKNMPQVRKDKYLNKAFSSFMSKKLDKQSLFSPSFLTANTYTNRLNLGKSIPAYWKNVKLTERFAAAGGVYGQEMFGDWGYLPGALGTAVTMPFLLNRNFYKRIANTRVGAVAVAPIELGKGFYSGMDSLFFVVSKQRPLTKGAYNKAANKLRAQGVPEEDIERRVYFESGIMPLEDSAAGKLQPFFIVDKKGIERLAAKGDKEYDILQDIADQINNTTDPIIRENQVEKIGAFLDMQNNLADMINKDRDRWLSLGNADLSNHPLNKLGGSLYDVLDLITTRAAVEGSSVTADLGVMVRMRIQKADFLYADRKDKIDSIGQFLADLDTTKSTYVMGEESTKLLNQIKNFIDIEDKFLFELNKNLNTLPEIFSRVFKQTEYDADEVFNPQLLTGKDTILADFYETLGLKELEKTIIPGLSAVEKHRQITHKYIVSVLDNLKYNREVQGDKNQTFIFNKFNEISQNRRTLMGNAVYGPFLKASKQSGSQPIVGEDIDNLFSNVFELLKKDPDSMVSKGLSGQHSADVRKIFKSALEPNGNEFRKFLLNSPLFKEMYDEGGWPAVNKALGFDVTNNITIYQARLNPELASDAFKELDLGDVFGELELTSNTIVSMHKILKDKHYRLTQTVKSGTSTPEQREMLSGYSELVGKDNESTLNIILKSNMDDAVYNTYLAATKIYAQHVAPHKYSRFEQLYRKTNRTNASLDDTIPGTGSRNQFNKSVKTQLEDIGKLIIDDPEDAYNILAQQYGTRARVPTGEVNERGVALYKDAYVLADADQAEIFRFVVRNAIHAHAKKNLQKGLEKVKGKYASNWQAIKDNDELNTLLTTYMAGGELDSKIIEFSNYTKIINGTEVWTGEVDQVTGKLLYSTDTPFSSRLQAVGDDAIDATLASERKEISGGVKGTKSKFDLVPLSTFSEQQGKLQFNYQDTQNRMFDNEFRHAVESNKTYQAEYKNLMVSFSSAKGDIQDRIEVFIQQERDIFDRLQEYLTTKTGYQPTPYSAQAEGSLSKATDALLSAPENIDTFIETLVTAKGKRGLLLKGSEKARRKEATKYVESLLKKRFVEEIMVDTGTTRLVVDPVTGKEAKIPVKNMLPDYDNFIAVRDKYGPLLERFLGEEETKMYLQIAQLSSLLNRKNYLELTASTGIGRKIMNSPTTMTVSNGLAKVFAWSRGVVSPSYVGVDGSIRVYRKSKADMLTAVLTSPTTPDSQGITAIKALYEVLENNNFDPRYGRALSKLLPVIYWESNVRATGYEFQGVLPGDLLYGVPAVDVPIPEGFETKNKYNVEGEGGLVRRPVSSESETKYKDQILEEFGSMTGFRKAVEDKDPKALLRLNFISRTQKDNNLKKELETLGIIK